MKRLSLLLSLSWSCLLMVAGISFAETYYLQTANARVMSKASFASDPLGVVRSGYSFSSLGKEGDWLKLDFNGKKGYIPALQAATSPPLARRNSVPGETATPKLSSRTRSSQVVAVAGVKGLTYEDRARDSARERADYASLEKMEAIKVLPEEIAAFLKGGK